MADRRTTAVHLGAVLAAGIALRALLFNAVGVWGDFGFYVYDARLINRGLVPFVDFIGRSPLFNYAYAYAVASIGHPIPLLRVFISAWWVLAAIPVYWLGRRAHSHRAGLVSAAVLLCSPFGLVYGMWANTQSLAALLAVTAGVAVLAREDHLGYALAGALLGAAFLSRRSVITIAAGIGFWTIWQRRHDVAGIVTRGQVAAVGFGAVIMAGYVAMAGGDITLTRQLFETHAVGLVSSSGRGGFPLITDTSTPPVTNEIDSGRIPIFNDLCQMCGAWTARTFAKTLLVTIPVVGPLAVYARDWSDQWFSDVHRQYLGGILGALALYAVVRVLLAGYWTRVLAIGALVGYAAAAFVADRAPRDVLYGRVLSLQLAVLGMLAAGYLYRNRVLHTYYFMDFMPFLAVVSGVGYTLLWERL